jgi:hypothetical protein
MAGRTPKARAVDGRVGGGGAQGHRHGGGRRAPRAGPGNNYENYVKQDAFDSSNEAGSKCVEGHVM